MKRRTNEEIRSDIFKAVSELVLEEGFNRITLVKISKKTKMEMSVIIRHFKSLENLLEQYTKQFDSFINDALTLDMKKIAGPEELLNALATQLMKNIHKNKEMQELLIWELCENNQTTRRSARRRDHAILELLPGITETIEDADINGNAVIGILTAGMYYLLIRKDRSPYCGIDFSSKSGRMLLVETLTKIMLLIKKSTLIKDEDED